MIASEPFEVISMSKKRFIKLLDSEETNYLLEHHPNAFLLLTLIAIRARRVSGKPDGLEIGEAYIGDYRKCGIETERKYRTAKTLLQLRCHLLICETCRTRKKSTTGMTTHGTKVKLLKSTVWDINPESNDDRDDDRATTERRPSDDEEERNKNDKNEKKKEKIKKEKPSKPEKIFFREFVSLTQDQHDSLVEKNGNLFFEAMLDILDAYKGSSGKKYPSDFHVMKQGGWVFEKVHEKQNQPSQSRQGDKFSRTTKDKQGNPIMSYAESQGLF